MQLRAADDVSNSAATQEGTRQEDEARSINHELRQRQTELEARMGRNDETSVGRIQQEARVIDECKGRLATRPLQAGKGGLSLLDSISQRIRTGNGRHAGPGNHHRLT